MHRPSDLALLLGVIGVLAAPMTLVAQTVDPFAPFVRTSVHVDAIGSPKANVGAGMSAFLGFDAGVIHNFSISFGGGVGLNYTNVPPLRELVSITSAPGTDAAMVSDSLAQRAATLEPMIGFELRRRLSPPFEGQVTGGPPPFFGLGGDGIGLVGRMEYRATFFLQEADAEVANEVNVLTGIYLGLPHFRGRAMVGLGVNERLDRVLEKNPSRFVLRASALVPIAGTLKVRGIPLGVSAFLALAHDRSVGDETFGLADGSGIEIRPFVETVLAIGLLLDFPLREDN